MKGLEVSDVSLVQLTEGDDHTYGILALLSDYHHWSAGVQK